MQNGQHRTDSTLESMQDTVYNSLERAQDTVFYRSLEHVQDTVYHSLPSLDETVASVHDDAQRAYRFGKAGWTAAQDYFFQEERSSITYPLRVTIGSSLGPGGWLPEQQRHIEERYNIGDTLAERDDTLGKLLGHSAPLTRTHLLGSNGLFGLGYAADQFGLAGADEATGVFLIVQNGFRAAHHFTAPHVKKVERWFENSLMQNLSPDAVYEKLSLDEIYDEEGRSAFLGPVSIAGMSIDAVLSEDTKRQFTLRKRIAQEKIQNLGDLLKLTHSNGRDEVTNDNTP